LVTGNFMGTNTTRIKLPRKGAESETFVTTLKTREEQIIKFAQGEKNK